MLEFERLHVEVGEVELEEVEVDLTLTGVKERAARCRYRFAC